MRVCQFRHFGEWTALRGAATGHLSERDYSSILQTLLPLSILRATTLNPPLRLTEQLLYSHYPSDILVKPVMLPISVLISRMTPLSRPNSPGRQQRSSTTEIRRTKRLPQDVTAELRHLAHDLSNSIETIMQAGYLLAQTKLDANGKRWAHMIESAVEDAARINRGIREILRGQQEKANDRVTQKRRAS